MPAVAAVIAAAVDAAAAAAAADGATSGVSHIPQRVALKGFMKVQVPHAVPCDSSCGSVLREETSLVMEGDVGVVCADVRTCPPPLPPRWPLPPLPPLLPLLPLLPTLPVLFLALPPLPPSSPFPPPLLRLFPRLNPPRPLNPPCPSCPPCPPCGAATPGTVPLGTVPLDNMLDEDDRPWPRRSREGSREADESRPTAQLRPLPLPRPRPRPRPGPRPGAVSTPPTH